MIHDILYVNIKLKTDYSVGTLYYYGAMKWYEMFEYY